MSFNEPKIYLIVGLVGLIATVLLGDTMNPHPSCSELGRFSTC